MLRKNTIFNEHPVYDIRSSENFLNRRIGNLFCRSYQNVNNTRIKMNLYDNLKSTQSHILSTQHLSATFVELTNQFSREALGMKTILTAVVGICKQKNSAPIGAWKCNYDRLTDRQTNQNFNQLDADMKVYGGVTPLLGNLK